MRTYIVKFGTKVLLDKNGDIDLDFFKNIAKQVMWIRDRGDQVVIVCSGAVAIGIKKLKLNKTIGISDTVLSQSASTIGNRYLFNMWAEAFQPYGLEVAAMLLSNEEVEKNPDLRTTLKLLLTNSLNTVLIVNENDVVTTEELRNLKQEGDNDMLAMHLTLTLGKIFSQKVTAIICTDVDGIMDFDGNLVSVIENVAIAAQYIDTRFQSNVVGVSRGGMDSKIRVATKLHPMQIPYHIVNGRKEHVLVDIALGKTPGTYFAPTNLKGVK